IRAFIGHAFLPSRLREPELGRLRKEAAHSFSVARGYRPPMAGLAVVLLSGGMDSMVAAGLAREAGYRLLALSIDYHQRHRIELEAAARIAARRGVERRVVLPLDLTGIHASAPTAAPGVPCP